MRLNQPEPRAALHLVRRLDGPIARRIAVAAELKGRDVVQVADPAGNDQALARLDVFRLNSVARLDQVPATRRIAVTVELQGWNVVFGADSACNRQALACPDVGHLEAIACLDQPPALPLTAVAVELHRRRIVVGSSFRDRKAPFGLPV